MSNALKRKQAAEEHNELEGRLDTLFEQAEADGLEIDEREEQVSRTLIANMKRVYENTLVQCKLEMRVAKRLKDEQMINQVRGNAKRCLESILELEAVLAELDSMTGGDDTDTEEIAGAA